jgi:hypothetical protein
VAQVSRSGVRPFRSPVPEYLTMLRLHLPLIEPDVRISRIRLSDKISCVRPQQAMPLRTKLNEAQLVVQKAIREACILPVPHLVLVT